MDHLRINKVQGTRHFVNPPQLPTQEEVDLFAQDLRDSVIPAKLAEFIEEAEGLVEYRKQAMKKLDMQILRGEFDKDKDPEFSQYFWTTWINTQFSEFFVIQKWLKYWLQLSEMATKTPIKELHVVEENGVGEDAIARAKEHPIEELYEGSLRHSFGRLMGICPFHEEKTPSFVIYNDNHFYCFGCNTWGDAIDFYMKTKNVNMIDAVKALQ